MEIGTQQLSAANAVVNALATSITGRNLALPREIWTYIFRRCINSSFASKEPGCWWTPLRLSHVCREWHNIIHGDPLAWTKIEFREQSCLTQWLPFWLAKSRDQPLDVRFRPRASESDLQTALLVGAFAMLVGCGRAFHALHIAASATTFAALMNVIQELNRESLCPLREMGVCIEVGDYYPSSLSLHALRPATHLEALQLHLTSEPATFAFLTQLILPVGRGRDANELVGLLACCPALQTLATVVEFTPAVMQATPRLRARLPCLETLFLSDVTHVPYDERPWEEDAWGSVWLLNRLELPALRALPFDHCMVHVPSLAARLGLEPGTPPGVREDALQFMDTPWESVHSVDFGPNDFGAARIIAWLPRLPNLDTVCFLDEEPSPEVLAALLTHVPKLFELEIDVLERAECVDAVLDLVEAWAFAPHRPGAADVFEEQLILRIPGGSVDEEELKEAVSAGRGKLERNQAWDSGKLMRAPTMDDSEEPEIHVYFVERTLPQ